MPGVKGSAKSDFPQIRTRRDIYEVLKKLRFRLEKETMDEVIEWLLIRARAKEILSISESKEYSEILNGSIYIPFRLQYGVMDSETLKDIMDSLIQGLHDKKTEIVRAVKDMISQWNRDNQENQIEL